MGCISVFRLRTPPLIRTKKELSEKVQLLEVRDVWIGSIKSLVLGSSHTDSISHLVRLWETSKLPLSW